MTDRIDDFQSYRKKMNSQILEIDNLGIKRFFRTGGFDGAQV
jgi:hypothetical protein